MHGVFFADHITYLSGVYRLRSASSSSGNRMDSDPLTLSSEFTFDTYKSESISESELRIEFEGYRNIKS